MGLLAEILIGIVSKRPLAQINETKRVDYIFYKIVDLIFDSTYILQCINTEAIFQCDIGNLVRDADILHSLHPIQACYVGIEYARFTKKFSHRVEPSKKPIGRFAGNAISRYGVYSIYYINRKGDVCIFNKETGQEFVMDPRDIALTEELIREFDAAQAFYIGFWAGNKLNNFDQSKMGKKSTYLRVVK